MDTVAPDEDGCGAVSPLRPPPPPCVHTHVAFLSLLCPMCFGSAVVFFCVVMKRKKQTKLDLSPPTVRTFQSKWLLLYPFLRFDCELGMWCVTCIQFKHLRDVRGHGAAVNALVEPTKIYRHEKLKDHENSTYHRAALHHLSKKSAVVHSALLLPFSPTVREQLIVYFNVVYSMASRGVAHQQVEAELSLLRHRKKIHPQVQVVCLQC